MKILQISGSDEGGGAFRVPFDLHRYYQSQGHDARLLVKTRRTSEQGVAEYDSPNGSWANWFISTAESLSRLGRFRGKDRLQQWLFRTAVPGRWFDVIRGREIFRFPSVLDWCEKNNYIPDVIHLHNLHGDYFNLEELPILSQRFPVVWTLHDTWAFTGHCAYFIDCTRWKNGCGSCPDLRRYPALLRDGTAENWRRKRAIYNQSRLTVVTPSRWLYDCVQESIITPVRLVKIPYGIDQSVFSFGDKKLARKNIGLPIDSFIVLCVLASARQTNPYKDSVTIAEAISILSSKQIPRLKILVLGSGAKWLRNSVTCAGYISDSKKLANYYQAADVLLHAAYADNYPLVILEAMACGTPIIATAVGGITEAIENNSRGILVPSKNAIAITDNVLDLFYSPDKAHKLSIEAMKWAISNARLSQQANAYLELYSG